MTNGTLKCSSSIDPRHLLPNESMHTDCGCWSGSVGRRRKKDRAGAVLDEVGAGALMEVPLDAVSGGEFQRILLARALLRDPDRCGG